MVIMRSHKWITRGLLASLALLGLAAWLWLGVGAASPAPAAALVYVRTDGDDTVCTGLYDKPASSAPNCAFKTFWQGVYSVDSGGVVVAAAGVYTESVGINKSLTLQGAGAGQTIIDGNGTSSGISVYASDARVTVSDVTIRNGSASWGGGLYNMGTLTLAHSIIVSNTGTAGAGGIFNTNGALFVSDCAILNNTAQNVGNVGAGGGIENYYGVLTVADSIVSGNIAVASGGGIMSSNGALAIRNSVISNNRANGQSAAGGGLFSASPAALTNVAIINNSAVYTDAAKHGYGGGLHSQDPMTMTNVTVSGNTSDWGGGVSNSDSMVILNSTIANNKLTALSPGRPGGIQSYAAMTVTNSLVAGNDNQNCYIEAHLMRSNGHNLEDSDSCVFSAASDIVNTNPRLSPLADNGGETWTHALGPASPAVDAGNDAACPPTDQRGKARIDGNKDGVVRCDIGAYELDPFFVYLPLVLR